MERTPADTETIGAGITEPLLAGSGSDHVTDPDGIAARPAAPRRLERGRAIGRYLIVERLGAGGMGVVFRAFDPDLDRSVAIKLVGAAGSAGGASDTLQVRERLMREAQAMARLSHPHVIAVYDVGLCDAAGAPIDDPSVATLVYVAMEFVDGDTLGGWRARGTRTWPEIRDAFVAAGRGLAAAHAAGLIHRDFKPDNVMIGRDGRVRVLDFGLARAHGSIPTVRNADIADLRSTELDSLERSMTAAGAVMGTPAYMSPEQHLGAPTDAKSDQFSFCVAMFEALYGARPFAGDTVAAVAFNVLQGKVTVPDGAAARAPRFVLDALLRGLSVEADARFPSMEALLQALTVDPSRRRRRVWLAAGAFAALAVGVGLGTRLPDRARAEAAIEPCTGAAATMAETWSPKRRDAIAAAFAETGRSYASDTWTRAATRIDARADAWIAEHTAACRATRVTAEQSEARMDARIGCLERQRRELDALLAGLARPDDTVVERAIDAVVRLPEPDACRVPAEAGAAPDDPDLARIAATIEAALPPIHAAIALGNFAEAQAALAPWVATADALDHPPVTAQVRWTQARLADAPKQGRDLLEQALFAATAAGDDDLAAVLAARLTEKVGYALADREGGERWLALGRALHQRLGGHAELAAELDGAEGEMLVAAGQYADALVAHGRARDYWAGREGAGASLASVLLDIGAAHVQLGEIDRAIAIDTEALGLRRIAYGDDHPETAAALREVGNAYAAAHDWDAAEPKLQEALRIQRAAKGERSTSVAVLLDDLGRVARRRDDLDTAIARHTEALGIWEERLGDPHADVAVSLLNLGYTLVAAGRSGEALAQQQRALAMFEAALGPEHPYVVYASNSVGASLVTLERFAEARPVLERALALSHVSVDPTLFAETKFTLATALVGDPAATRADRQRARTLAEEALASYRTQAERWQPQIADIEAWLRDAP